MVIKKILVLDDDITIRSFLQDFFEDRGYNVTTAGDGVEGMEKYKADTFDIVVSDMLMPKMIGIDVLRNIKAIKPAQKIIMMTGVREESMMEKAKSLGCHLYITKPVKLDELEARVAECFDA